MEAIELTKAIVEYGIIPVVLAVMMFLLVLMIKRQNSSNEEQSKRLDAQEERLTALTELNLRTTNSKIHSKEEEDDNRQVNTLIKSQLDAIVKNYGVNRAFCVAYHNGGTFLNSRNFTKFSMISESVDNKTKTITTEYQNVQRALFVELDNELADHGECFIKNIEDIKTDSPGCYQLLKTWGTESIYFKALVDCTTKVVLGFIAAEFNEATQVDVNALILELCKTAQRISGAIELTHNRGE